MSTPDSRAAADTVECRCICGSLVARVVDRGVELKCRRCKRTLIVPLEPAAGAHVAPHRVEAG